ncbi:TetR/AcrR family transcriptional regulator [Streptomyces sp. NPDC002870]|uniref:TetR/AcrR family transcriptional regulator n=1 Tax=Streptomyces sp. NPDC002870 TaxID=3364666 RepID=UPI0036B99BB2
MATQEERRRVTRRRIVDAARDLFLRQGIEATSTEALLEAAGVSRGAMYHHFASRNDIVATVYEEEASAAIARAVDRMPEGASAPERLVTGCLAWLDEVSSPEVARLLIEDGPAALGWQRCRQIEERYSLGRVRAELETAVGTAETRVPSVRLAARLLNAALGEAALIMTGAADRAAVRSDIETTLRALVSGLMDADAR